MAHLRARKWTKKRTRYYVVTEDGRERPAGADKATARRILNAYEEKKRLRAHGIVDPPTCSWTLGELSVKELTDASERGLEMDTRRKVWRAILAELGGATPLNNVGQGAIGRLSAPGLKASTINRRRALLSHALKLARTWREESGYTGDPFASVTRLSERDARRPRALTKAEAGQLLRLLPEACRNWAELQLLTAARPGEVGVIDGDCLRFPAHKRGRPKVFTIAGRLQEILFGEAHVFSRSAWERASKAMSVLAGVPAGGVRPHDLRHTALTWAGEAPGASLVGLMRLGGWTTPSMASRYLHPTDEAMPAIVPFGAMEEEAYVN